MDDPVVAARRRIRYLTPWNAGKVLAHPRYQTRPFLILYLERIDEASHEDPEAGFLYALHVQELARRIAVGGVAGYGDESERHSFVLVALAALAEAAYGAGEPTKAQASFAEGVLLERKAKTTSWARIAFCAARAHYLLSLGQDPSSLIREAHTLLSGGVAQPQCARYLRARILHAQVRVDLLQTNHTLSLSELLTLTQGPSPRLTRLDSVVLEELLGRIRADAIARPSLAAVAATIARRRKLARGEARVHLLWIEGLINRELGSLRNAKRRLLWAKHYAEKHQEQNEITNDLLAVLRELGEDTEIVRLREEADL